MAGAAYTLSHAINKLTPYHAINLRSTNSFAEYPAFAEMRDYDATSCRRMIEKADVVIFHTAIRPYLSAFGLNKQRLKNKKLFLYFHGSELRFYGKEILAQADEMLETYTILVSTPDLLLHCPKPAKWLPVARSFTEIRQRWSLCKQDREALKSFAEPKVKVVFAHAPSDETKKGSETFYRVVTRVMQELPHVAFMTIRNQPWYACLRLLSSADVYMDQDPPFLGSYGMTSVEASVWNMPLISRMSSEVVEIIKKETGLNSPFITWRDEDDLTAKVFLLAQDEKLRRKFGAEAYNYCRQVHDEAPVVSRFTRILEEAETYG